MRNFSQIVEEEKTNRNILEIKLTKITSTDANGETFKPKHLSFDDIGEFIFDVLKINPEDCLSYDYNTGRYDSREIKFKPNINLDQYVRQEPLNFKDHLITTKKQLHGVTRVTFKNVPLNVPDEEILHLCLSYGVPIDNKVHHEMLTNARNKGMLGSTRYVDMKLNRGAALENYYWLEGPLQGDQGRRVLVLHAGQQQQCSHCLRKSSTGCPGGGNGKICEMRKTP